MGTRTGTGTGTGPSAGTGATAGTRVRVRWFAAAQAAAGRDEETVEVSPTTTVADLLADRVAAHGERLAAVLPRCSVLVDGVVRHDLGSAVGPAQGVDVLPPFAGG